MSNKIRAPKSGPVSPVRFVVDRSGLVKSRCCKVTGSEQTWHGRKKDCVAVPCKYACAEVEPATDNERKEEKSNLASRESKSNRVGPRLSVEKKIMMMGEFQFPKEPSGRKAGQGLRRQGPRRQQRQ